MICDECHCASFCPYVGLSPVVFGKGQLECQHVGSNNKYELMMIPGGVTTNPKADNFTVYTRIEKIKRVRRWWNR